MSGMYKDHAKDGDVIYRQPPIGRIPPDDVLPPADIRTGPPLKIHFQGTGRHDFLGYVAEFTIGHKYSRVPVSSLQSALVQALVTSEVEIAEVPVTGGCPRQDYVKLGFNDISYALKRVSDSLPKLSMGGQSPSGMG